MEKEFNEKIKSHMGQIKYVKRGFLGLYYYWTKPLEAHKSLRNAEILKGANELLKIEDRDIQLKLRGYDGNYNDSAVDVLKQIPDVYFGLGNIFAYSLKVKKIVKNKEGEEQYVKARVTLFSALDVPKEIREQEVLFNDDYSFVVEQQ